LTLHIPWRGSGFNRRTFW